MNSDIGITTLLNRLKQSIASARDFAAFLKKRSSLEEEQATGLKRLAKSQADTIKRAEAKSGSYALSLSEVMRLHERMADNGMQFALSLHQMHEDLNDLSMNMERGRKQWKHDGLDAEKRSSDAEAAMHKAKTRYDGLAEDYDRARTGDTKGSRRLGLKGPKSAEQYEQDLMRKVQAADTDYEDKVRQAKQQRETLLRSERPRAVKALQELIQECDSALTLQLQKFATFNEKLLLGNGLAVTPLGDGPKSQQSMRDLIYGIDNGADFNSFVGGHYSKVPARPSEIKYEQHPTLAPKTQQPAPRSVSTSAATTATPTTSQAPQLTLNTGGTSSLPSSMNNRYGSAQIPQQTPQSSTYGQQPSFMQSSQTAAPSYGGASQSQPAYSASQPSTTRDAYNAPQYGSAPPYPAQSTDRSGGGSGYPTQPTNMGSMAARPYGSPVATTQPTPAPLRPVFGVSLEELFARDQSAVPMVVIQCILAVDTFGLDVEGIYRLSGTASHINQLKSQFDHNAGQVDFRNPAAFFHDVNSVATLLKQFFRDLPDPLFTRVGYTSFIDAARIDDANQRRDALHQSINDLPDPNYATLRALVLHLHRVMQNEGRNRMGANNLALCFA